MATNTITVEVELGPVALAALRVIGLGAELLDALPADHPKRLEMLKRMLALGDVLQEKLRQQGLVFSNSAPSLQEIQ